MTASSTLPLIGKPRRLHLLKGSIGGRRLRRRCQRLSSDDEVEECEDDRDGRDENQQSDEDGGEFRTACLNDGGRIRFRLRAALV